MGSRAIAAAAAAVGLSVLVACSTDGSPSGGASAVASSSPSSARPATPPAGTSGTARGSASAPTSSLGAAPRTVRFTAAGDYSSTADARSVLRLVGRLGADLHLALGDLSYGRPGEEGAWCDLVRAGVGDDFPFELVSGNHESDGLNGDIRAFRRCLPNRLPGLVGDYARQYYVDVPQGAPLVRFVLLSPALDFPGGSWSYARGTDRYAWTSAALAGARAAGIPWVVVGLHKPCLSVGRYECDPGPDLQQLLVAEHVDLVLSGHEHLYQRTKQLGGGSGCVAVRPGRVDPACVRDADSSMEAGAGTVFVTVGTGGVPLRDVNPADAEAGWFAAWSGANREPTHGLLDVSVTPDRLVGTFRRATGAHFEDRFSITRR